MAPIDSPLEAEALARSIIRELEYGDRANVRGGHVQHARTQFRARVVPERFDDFERALVGAGFGWAAEPGTPESPLHPDELEVAGVPRRASNLPAIVGISLAVVIGGVLVYFVGGAILRSATRKTVARAPIAAIGQGGVATYAAPPGTELWFSVGADECSWSGYNCIMLEIEAIKGEATVARRTCCGYSVKSSMGSAFGGTSQTRDDCVLRVPSPGADRFRVATRLSRPQSSLTCSGMEIGIRR